LVPQDIHIHTVYSTGDGAVAPQQKPAFLGSIGHARITGISDHYEFLTDDKVLESYFNDLYTNGFYAGTEVNGPDWTDGASKQPFDYFIYHCYDIEEAYPEIDTLLNTGKPVIIAHPFMLGTDLSRVPADCYVEINNRYIWRCEWDKLLPPWKDKFNWICSSDAHKPNQLNQNVVQYVRKVLDIPETMIFKNPYIPTF